MSTTTIKRHIGIAITVPPGMDARSYVAGFWGGHFPGGTSHLAFKPNPDATENYAVVVWVQEETGKAEWTFDTFEEVYEWLSTA